MSASSADWRPYWTDGRHANKRLFCNYHNTHHIRRTVPSLLCVDHLSGCKNDCTLRSYNWLWVQRQTTHFGGFSFHFGQSTFLSVFDFCSLQAEKQSYTRYIQEWKFPTAGRQWFKHVLVIFKQVRNIKKQTKKHINEVMTNGIYNEW